jgi:hypothetical protein
MKTISLILTIIALSGCAAQMDAFAGLGVIKEEVSSFDNKRIISVSPTWVASDGPLYAASTKVGAIWKESSPDEVLIILKHDGSTGYSSDVYKSYESLSVNIDGNIKTFETAGTTEHTSSNYNTVSRSISTESTAIVPIPLEYLKAMVEGEKVMLRFNGTHRYEDGIFSKETGTMGQEMAKARIVEFLKLI